jgi:glycosyltransferase involved in cell wall biosynthesis
MTRNSLFKLREKVLKMKPQASDKENLSHLRRKKTGLLFISSFPPRECGIATYSQDLVRTLNNKFRESFDISICALESDNEQHSYPEEVQFTWNTSQDDSYLETAERINFDETISLVLIQHEFGLFAGKKARLLEFLGKLRKPVVVVFHTVLKDPDTALKNHIRELEKKVKAIIVMTENSAGILKKEYDIAESKISVIPHGTHLVENTDKQLLKSKYGLGKRKILSTFGLLSSGKSIETTLNALPDIIERHPDVLFLILGKTHPTIIQREGEAYRDMLKAKIRALNLTEHVRFVNEFLPLDSLLEYLQLTDIYLFTSKDPNQAVSGTFSYAISCGCPVISTPIPHAREVLQKELGYIFDFGNSGQLAEKVNLLLGDDSLMKALSSNCLHYMAATAWENTAISHARLFHRIGGHKEMLSYHIPEIKLDHIKKMTTGFGMIQFSKINQPDLESGYTLDDNARAMVSLCQHYELKHDKGDLVYIRIYLDFIRYCQQQEGYFLNYVDRNKVFTAQNNETNLADSNGRAIWALGYLISLGGIIPDELIDEAEEILQNTLQNIKKIHSTRAMAFAIKGLYYRSTYTRSAYDLDLIRALADRMVQMYKHEKDQDWQWFESYMTYANSILPEALLCAWMATGDPVYKQVAKTCFDFLLSNIFSGNTIQVISNKGWMHKANENSSVEKPIGGEQPIDVAYTVLALNKFYAVFHDQDYRLKMENAFNWFLGNNHLKQIIYNPCTGGCYDGLEENYVNLNQGAESTVSYLMARLCIEKLSRAKIELSPDFHTKADFELISA